MATFIIISVLLFITLLNAILGTDSTNPETGSLCPEKATQGKAEQCIQSSPFFDGNKCLVVSMRNFYSFRFCKNTFSLSL